MELEVKSFGPTKESMWYLLGRFDVTFHYFLLSDPVFNPNNGIEGKIISDQWRDPPGIFDRALMYYFTAFPCRILSPIQVVELKVKSFWANEGIHVLSLRGI